MSVVDQRAVGVLRRLLLRVTLVLGGVFAVTAVGWLLSSAAAHADELPSIPPVSSLLDSAQQQLSTSDVTPTLVKATLGKTAIDKTVLTKTGLAKALPPTPVTTADVVPHHQAVPATPTTTATTTTTTTRPTPRPARHVATTPRPATPERGATTVEPHTLPVRPAGPDHRAPVLPPLQPAGSSDSTAHGTGNLAGGPGGASLPTTPVLGTGVHPAGSPSTPRLAVAPGLQPGTSPD